MSVRITSDRAALVDELGEIKDRLAVKAAIYRADIAVDEARGTSLEAEVLSWYDHEPAEAEAAPAGEKYVAEIGPRGNRSSIISISKVYKRLGRSLFMQHAEIALGTLRKVLKKDERERFILTERTGDRALTMVRKAS